MNINTVYVACILLSIIIVVNVVNLVVQISYLIRSKK